MVLIGIIGKPNAGKSTLLNAVSDANAQVANYPFTTIKPNKGIAFVFAYCPHEELNLQCKPRNSKCKEGKRLIPVNVVDVAGLVEGAHEGKGMGNQFLSDVATADALVIVSDASGATDSEGNPCDAGNHDAVEDVSMVLNELDQWFFDVVKRNAQKTRGKSFSEFAQSLSGLGVSQDDLKEHVSRQGLNGELWMWSEDQLRDLAKGLRETSKPFVIAANKADSSFAQKNIERLENAFPNNLVVATSAESELALKRAHETGLIDYDGKTFTVLKELSEKQKKALDKIKVVLEKTGSTGTQQLINSLVFNFLNMIVVYPVEDENKYSDHFGNVLPDAILLPKGSKPVDLARAIHTDLATNFLHAVDCKKRVRVGKDYKLKDNDVIKIVSTK
ncbi:MAG: redox-regulated ATPase YchF [Candidatus Micrarchaeia archaeon]